MVINNKFLNNLSNLNNINRIQGNATTPARPNPVNQEGSFGKILQDHIQEKAGLKFSKHAEMRLQTRNIVLSQTQKDKISQALNKAEAKGVKDALVMADNVALVVNVKSRTVITAVNNDELKDNIFTNIDGALFT